MIIAFFQKNTKLFALIFLIIAYPILFYAANNNNSFSILELTIAYTIIFLVSCLGLLLGKFLLIRVFNVNENTAIKITYGCLLLLFLVMIRHVIFNNPELYYLSYLKNYSVYTKWFSVATFAISFFSIGFFLINKHEKMFMGIFLILNGLNLIKIISFLLMTASADELKDYTQISLKNKKNIYFILTDSLTNIAGMQQLGIKEENIKFLRDLQSLGFTHYSNFFTSLQATQFALFTFFNLSYQYHGVNGYKLDLILRLRHILNDGKLYQILKDNGYKINILHELDVFLLDTCNADQCYFNVTNKLRTNDSNIQQSQSSNIKEKVLSIITFLLPVNLDSLLNKKNILFFDPKELSYNDKNAFIKGTLQRLQQLNLHFPNFTYIHAFTFPTHSDTDAKTINHCNETAEIEKYNARIKATADFVLSMVHTIQSRDNNALIIIAGDHGPYIFNKCSREGIKLASQVMERQGAFLSIFWGKDYRHQYDERIKSSHNLFRYVLSYLAQDEKLLQDADPDNAYTLYSDWKIGQTISDGMVNKSIPLVKPN